jgi:heat shock protein HslJ
MRITTIVVLTSVLGWWGSTSLLAARLSVERSVGSDSQTATPGSPVPLEKTSWTAIELGGQPVPASKHGREPQVVFDGRDGFTGTDGCSRVVGSYQMMGPIIEFGRLAESESACASGSDAVRAFRLALASAHVWRIKEGRLEFRTSSGVLVARFASPSSPASAQGATAATLQHTIWRLVRFQGREDIALAPDDTAKYILSFSAPGRLSAQVGCQRGRGTWKASGRSELQFGPLALTRAQCPSTPLRARVIDDWRRVQSYVIRNGHLFLSLMGEGGVYEFEPLRSAS